MKIFVLDMSKQEEDHCCVCGGSGIRYEQPYGTAIRCWMCEGTGKVLNLMQREQIKSLQHEMYQIAGKLL